MRNLQAEIGSIKMNEITLKCLDIFYEDEEDMLSYQITLIVNGQSYNGVGFIDKKIIDDESLDHVALIVETEVKNFKNWVLTSS